MLEYRICQPAARRHARPLLLIHGAWHGAWCWAAVMEDFAARGFEVHAISLRGHGASSPVRHLNIVGYSAYLEDLTLAISRIRPAPLVIGHNMGGYIVQLYLSQPYVALPGAVLLCPIPRHGSGVFSARIVVARPLATLRAIVSANLRHIVGTPQRARESFFRPDTPLREVQAAAEQLVAESWRIVFEGLVRFPQPRHVRQTPLLLIAAERDAVFGLWEQRLTAGAYRLPLQVIPGAAHDLMLDPAWPQAADAIERFAATLP